MDQMENTFKGLGWYLATVLMGHILQGVIFYPVLLGELVSSGQTKLVS